MDDRALAPSSVEGALHVFVLPAGPMDVRIVSRAGTPHTARPWLEDRRLLGVRISGIRMRDNAGVREIVMDDPALADGWWAGEPDGAAMARWTDGNAALTVPEGTMMVELRIAGTMRYPASRMAGAERSRAA